MGPEVTGDISSLDDCLLVNVSSLSEGESMHHMHRHMMFPYILWTITIGILDS